MMTEFKQVFRTMVLGISLAGGVGLAGTTLTLTTAQAAQKFTQNVTFPANINGKSTHVVFKNLSAVPKAGEGNYFYAKTPKIKGYTTNSKVLINLSGTSEKNYRWLLADSLTYYKVKKVTAKNKIKASGSVQGTNGKQHYQKGAKTYFFNRKVTGAQGSIVTIKAPQKAGYKANVSKVKLGLWKIAGDTGFDTLTDLRYTRVYGYKVAKFSARKSGNNLKLAGKFTQHNRAEAKQRPATYAIIKNGLNTYRIQLKNNKSFNLKVRATKVAQKLTVASAYRTVKKSHGKTTVTYPLNSKIKTVNLK